MTFKSVFKYYPLCLVCAMSACIQAEAPNAEADIETCVLPKETLLEQPTVRNNRIDILLTTAAEITKLAPEFTLTEGATIDPPSGTVRDFTTDQTYTVTSQDKQWQKTYTVSCAYNESYTTYSFETVGFNKEEADKKQYYVFNELNSEGKAVAFWDSGNQGYSFIAKDGSTAADYPTSSSEDGYKGKCVKLQTCKGLTLGTMINIPIAAGNLFIGTFEMKNMFTPALQATHFGRPFTQVPTSLTGKYKYKAGETFKDKNNKPITNRRDTFDIYAIMYETDDQVKYLDGTNALTHPNLVMTAKLDKNDAKETDEWATFDIPFTLLPGKTIDEEKLKANKYNISVVFSSSKDGATFEGAIGSTLYIDEVKVWCKK